MPQEQPPKKELKIKIQLDEEISQGAYCNFVMVNHSETEFVLDFIFIQPQAPKAKVRSRVIVNAKNAKRTMKALEENIKKYEEKFGQIDLGRDVLKTAGIFH